MKVSDLLSPDGKWDENKLPRGCQEPTLRHVPPRDGSYGHLAVELAEHCGITLFPFQAEGLIDDLAYKNVVIDGEEIERWAAAETEEIISRRNGKTVRFVVLILFALFVRRERKILYTAHRDDTAKDVFDEVVTVLKRMPDMWAEVIDKGPRQANGQRSITLKTGQVVYFRTRGTDAGRGQGYQRLIFDEDQNLTEEEVAALMPLVSGEENAQLNYAGSAGGRHSRVQAKLRASAERAEAGLCYRGWHSEPDDDFDDLDRIARVNPRLGHGLSYTFVAKEFVRMSRAMFGRERCGAPTYPRGEGEGWVVTKERWQAAKDPASRTAPSSRLVFTLEADPQLERGTIGVAGFRTDGAVHIEVTDNAPGVLWMIDRAKDLQTKHNGEIVLDPNGPLGYLREPLTEAGVKVTLLKAEDLRDGAAWFFTELTPRPDPGEPDAEIPPPGIFHRGGTRLTQALAAAETRKFMDRWTWRRQVALEVDQGPLTAVTWSGWVLTKRARQTPSPAPIKAKGDARRRGHRKAPRRRTDDLSTAGF